jgi:hypothetical protein
MKYGTPKATKEKEYDNQDEGGGGPDKRKEDGRKQGPQDHEVSPPKAIRQIPHEGLEQRRSQG